MDDLVRHLNGMHHGLERYTAGDRSTWSEAPERRSELLGRYYDALHEAVRALGLPLPADRAPEEERRRQLEDLLRSVGIDLEVSRRPAPWPLVYAPSPARETFHRHGDDPVRRTEVSHLRGAGTRESIF